ncbi:MAG: FAD:protein FMN transferase [Acholeplasmataceae bacterium]
MKKIYTTIVLTIIMFFLVACKDNVVTRRNFVIASMDTSIGGYFYAPKKSHDKVFNGINNIYKDVEELTDNFMSHGDKHDIFYINNLIKDSDEVLTIEIDKLLYDILEEALYIYEETNGYFDFSMGKIIDVWKDLIDEYEHKGRVPLDKINETYEIVQEIDVIKDPISLSVEEDKYYVSVKPGVKIDLGAHVKGYATELVKQYLIEEGITDFLISGGSSSMTMGRNGNREEGYYIIGLKNPLGISENDYYGFYDLTDTSISTSGSYEQYVPGADNKWYHHIISPKTKAPVNKYYTITIIGDDAGLLDGFSTALFLMDLEEINDFITKHDEYELVIYENEENIINFNQSDRFRPRNK